jgi:beta-carotene ketolase (CrtO type)
VRVNTPVASILVRDDGSARGVRTASGEEIAARQVIATIHPGHLVNDLIEPQFVPQHVREEVRGLRDLGHGIGVTKIDAALSQRPDLLCGRPELWGSYMLINPEVDYLKRAIRSSMTGELPAEVPMWLLMPSAVDRTQVPPGSPGDTLYIYTPTVPCEVRGGWPAARQTWSDRAIDVVEQYAPGTRDALIGTYVKDPDELARMTGGHGSITHLDMSPDQMGPWRPCRSLAGYRTPVEGLWHAGAGAHPVGGVTGWSGRTVARTALRSLSRNSR